ncbi:MAG: hypothetical protein DRJ97_07350 [Thermoprotei archaeon]|nr:MAG: hypothetical protein DRJ97_07350 [Thermoprotei archaeon]
MKVEASREFLEELAKRNVKAVRVRLVEEVHEWTMCCAGDACVVVPKVVVEEGAGERLRFQVDGLEVYVSDEVASRAEGVIKLVVERGELRVIGVRLEAAYDVKSAYRQELPQWS